MLTFFLNHNIYFIFIHKVQKYFCTVQLLEISIFSLSANAIFARVLDLKLIIVNADVIDIQVYLQAHEGSI